jgi:hypothetical protein
VDYLVKNLHFRGAGPSWWMRMAEMYLNDWIPEIRNLKLQMRR